MRAWEKDNTIAKNHQKMRILTMREQMLISSESITIQTRHKKYLISCDIRNTMVPSF